MDNKKLNEDNLPLSEPEEKAWTDDFKKSVQAATKALAEQKEAWDEFWEEHIPGGLRKRHRYTTQGHGLRRAARRRRNKAAKHARRANRRNKKRSR